MVTEYLSAILNAEVTDRKLDAIVQTGSKPTRKWRT
jgi:hypothetical protein